MGSTDTDDSSHLASVCPVIDSTPLSGRDIPACLEKRGLAEMDKFRGYHRIGQPKAFDEQGDASRERRDDIRGYQPGEPTEKPVISGPEGG